MTETAKSIAPPAAPPPPSLGTHVVPPERLELIKAHIAILAATAIGVSDMLPLEADVSDFIAVVEAEVE
jgi:hypothetical protein